MKNIYNEILIGGNQGPPGPPGPVGAMGFQGYQGSIGVGYQGSIGYQGYQGNQGNLGTQGYQGYQGGGFQGTSGIQGYQGLIGSMGSSGNPGIQGFQGRIGFQGSQGFQGLIGLGVQGPQGIQGIAGTTGLLPITYVSTSPYTSSSNNRYICNFTGTMSFNLPSSLTNANTGNEITVMNISGQTINIVPPSTDVFIMDNNTSSPPGTSLSCSSTIPNASVTLIYLFTNQTNNYWIIKSVNGPWISNGLQTGTTNISNLQDVILTNPSPGQYLTYSGAQWINTGFPNIYKQIFLNSNGNIGTGYMGLNGFNGNEATVSMLSGLSMTITGMAVLMTSPPGNGNSWFFVARKNNVDTGANCTLSNLVTQNLVNFTFPVSYVGGIDLFDIRIAPIGSPSTPSQVYITLIYY